MTAVEAWSVASSIVSVVLAVLAIVLSIWFFVMAKNTEKDVAGSLTKIETQADSLQKLNARWMDRLTRFVTEERPRPADESIPQLVAILAQLPQTLTTSLTQVPQRATQEQLAQELISSYIAIYFYTAQTNYWAQFYLPEAANFDATNEFHRLVQRMVDTSYTDFTHIATVLAGVDQSRLEANPLAHLLRETKDSWRLRVRSTADVFVATEKAKTT